MQENRKPTDPDSATADGPSSVDGVKVGEADAETTVAPHSHGRIAASFGRGLTFDIELADGTSQLTVYERGAPRLKRSMSDADMEALFDLLPA